MKMIKIKGIVLEQLTDRTFKVKLADGSTITARLSAKLAMHFTLKVDDFVNVDISSSDRSSGTICITSFVPNARTQL